MVVQNNKQNFWLNFFEKDMILYQYHFFDKDIRYDIISHLRPRYRYDIISSKKKYFQCLVCPPAPATSEAGTRWPRFGLVVVATTKPNIGHLPPASEVARIHTLPFLKGPGLPILKWYSMTMSSCDL
jgi:hypothetical protein